MNRQRSWLRSFVKQFRGDMSPEGRSISAARRSAFGSFSRGLRNNITAKNLAAIQANKGE